MQNLKNSTVIGSNGMRRWLNGASAGLRGLMFYSTSADGHVYQWLLGKSAMTFQVYPSPSLFAHAVHQED